MPWWAWFLIGFIFGGFFGAIFMIFGLRDFIRAKAEEFSKLNEK